MTNGYPFILKDMIEVFELINEHRELHDELKKIKAEMGLEKNLTIKALYHSAVADNGRYMQDYQDLERLQK